MPVLERTMCGSNQESRSDRTLAAETKEMLAIGSANLTFTVRGLSSLPRFFSLTVPQRIPIGYPVSNTS